MKDKTLTTEGLTIRISQEVQEKLEKLRTHPRESWNDLIKRGLEGKR